MWWSPGDSGNRILFPAMAQATAVAKMAPQRCLQTGRTSGAGVLQGGCQDPSCSRIRVGVRSYSSAEGTNGSRGEDYWYFPFSWRAGYICREQQSSHGFPAHNRATSRNVAPTTRNGQRLWFTGVRNKEKVDREPYRRWIHSLDPYEHDLKNNSSNFSNHSDSPVR